MNNNFGFIMTEVLVGIALVMLMVSIASVQVRNYQHVYIKQQLSLLALNWHELQQRAMARGKQEDMLLDEDQHRYYVNGQWHDLPSVIRFGFLPNAKGPPSSPTTPLRSAITFPNKKISCFPDGTIQAGTVYLVDEGKRYMYALTSGVSAVSFLRKYRYDGAWRGY